jgi:hypothetical protein
LRGHGFQVLRFRTGEPLKNIDGVPTVIAEQLGLAGESPHPNLPPEGEGANSQEPHA